MKKRFLALLLAVLVVSSCLTIGAAADFTNDWTTWNQRDTGLTDSYYQWDDGTPAMKGGGCRITAQCKLMAEAGIIDDTSFDPDDYCLWLDDNDYIWGRYSGEYKVGETKTSGAGMIAYAATKGVTITRVVTNSYIGSQSVDEQRDTIMNYINQGYYVIVDATHPDTSMYHQAYIRRDLSLQNNTPYVSNSGSGVTPSSMTYKYNGKVSSTGTVSFNYIYVYSVSGTPVDPTPTKPDAPDTSVIKVDYYNETISFESKYEVSSDKSFASTISSGSKVNPGAILYVRVKAEGNIPASDATQVGLSSRPMPFDRVTFDEETGAFNSTASYEYSFDQTAWNKCTGELPHSAAAGHDHIYFRLAATNSSFASAPYEVSFPASIKPDAPEAGVVSFDYFDETLSYESKYEVSATDFGSVIASGGSITELVDGGVSNVYVRVKAEGNFPASDTTAVALPVRGAAPDKLVVTGETVDKRDDGGVSGVDASMEYRAGGGAWADCPESGVISGLADGGYEIRYKATNSSLASEIAAVTVEKGVPQTFTLSVTVPELDELVYNYAEPEAKPLTITSSGNTDSTIASVTVSEDSFVIGEGSETVPYGTSISDWTIRPATGLEAGTYTATVTVTYNNNAVATGTVSVVVNKAPQAAPGKPQVDRRDYDSIELKALAPNANGAAAEYRVNGGEWQSSPVFEGLRAGTSYVFEQRYAAVGSYLASPASSASFSTLSYNIPEPHDIIIIPSDHGTIDTSLSNASAGAVIEVTAEPDEGYELAYITVDGERVSGTSFKMPGHDVEVSAVFVREGAALPFADVAASAWYYDAVSYVYANGLMDGVSALSFNPDGAMTRAMVWAILARIDGETVTGADWAAEAREWAVAEGVSDGTDPDGYVTREQLVTMLYRYAGEPAASGSLSGWADAARVSDWAEGAMVWAVGEGVITGASATELNPAGSATRAECAAILMRYVEL